MARKLQPELRVICSPKSAIPNKGNAGVVIAQAYTDRMALGQGDGAGLGLQSLNPTVASTWLSTGAAGAFSDVSDTAEFVRMHKDGRVTFGASAQIGPRDEIAGWTLKGRVVPHDARVNNTVAGTSSLPQMIYTVLSGAWLCVRGSNGVAQFVNNGNNSNDVIKSADLKAKQGWQGDLYLSRKTPSSANAGKVGEVLLSWGGDSLRVRLLDNQPLQAQKKASNGQWTNLRRLDGATPIRFDGGYLGIMVRRIGGRLVITTGADAYHFLDTTTEGKGTASNWPAGPVVVQATGCRVRGSIFPIDYKNNDGTPQTATFTSREARASYIGDSSTPGYSAGWKPTPESVQVEVTAPAGAVQTKVTMTAANDGIDAPLVTKTLAQFPVSVRASSGEGIDIGPAVSYATLSEAMPPIMPGAELRLDIDRLMLDELFPNNAWRDYVDEFCPITFEWRWHYTSGEPGPWIQEFKGYIFIPKEDTTAPDERKLSLVCYDEIVRLKDPASIIDHRYPPLDILFARKQAAAMAGGAQALANLRLYGGECVREILRLCISQAEADRLNTTGYNDDTALGPRFGSMKFFSADHYPLLDAGKDSTGLLPLSQIADGNQIPTSGGWMLPAKYESDGLGWIGDFTERDQGVFFYGHPNGYDGERPYPIYGNIANIIAARQFVHVIPDAIYQAGSLGDVDADTLLQKVSIDARPDAHINRVLVLARGLFGDGLEGILPAMRMAVAEIGSDHPNAAYHTWERTKVIRNNLAGFPGAAEALAKLYISLLTDVVLRWPTFTFRGRDYRPLSGERPVHWGDRIKTLQSGPESDTGLGISGIEWRVERCEKVWDMQDQFDHWTTAWTRPLLNNGV
jgi:hypothetical protein